MILLLFYTSHTCTNVLLDPGHALMRPTAGTAAAGAVTAGVAEEDASSLIDSWQAAVVGSDTPEEEEGDDELAMF